MDLKELQDNDYKTETRHPWELGRLEVIISLLKAHVPNIFTERCNILDFGCGDLWLIEQLSARMPRAQFIAIDHQFNFMMLHAYNMRYGANQVPISVFNSLEESYNAHAGRIDLVLMLDVLQQADQEQALLSEVGSHSGISPLTPWLITVPADKSLFNNYDSYLGNKRRYGRKLLVNTLVKANLEVNKTGNFFFGLWFWRHIKKLFTAKHPKLSEWKGNLERTNRIKKWLLADFTFTQGLRYCRLQLPGLSLYAFARKKTEVKISGPC
jgi:hypothetical protein